MHTRVNRAAHECDAAQPWQVRLRTASEAVRHMLHPPSNDGPRPARRAAYVVISVRQPRAARSADLERCPLPDRLPFDPITEAARQWRKHWGAAPVPSMMAVTSLMRVEQILIARLNALLKPCAHVPAV